jgi:hypothetical protein
MNKVKPKGNDVKTKKRQRDSHGVEASNIIPLLSQPLGTREEFNQGLSLLSHIDALQGAHIDH